MLIYGIAINSIAYVLMCCDKYYAKTGRQRIAEKTLFFMAFILGAPGIYLGMQAPLHHKSAKPGFKYGIPLLLLVNLVSAYFLLCL